LIATRNFRFASTSKIMCGEYLSCKSKSCDGAGNPVSDCNAVQEVAQKYFSN
jgi:hypothetical protein